ncbi:hypothetical protein FBZ83_11976 [Azospirillum brasilense]|uniref:Uncharacterized protein n=1 Tax=Azospirillum brasilense TaxID=192 RepID=A0A560BUX5_AZOBR|nr:hypothetical protein [Azospirillum brasilense]TWA76425.1 hypothetical protein FBZ83_11976 [Azospirillum brasilense]
MDGTSLRTMVDSMLVALNAAPPLPQAPESHLGKLASYDALWARGVKVPVMELCDLERLERLGDAEITAGRRVGEDPNSREPGTDRSRAYWHGWQAGRMKRVPDEADAAFHELNYRVWWWVLRHTPEALRQVVAFWPDTDIANPEAYADLESALERGEPV